MRSMRASPPADTERRTFLVQLGILLVLSILASIVLARDARDVVAFARAVHAWMSSMDMSRAYNRYCFHFFDGEEDYIEHKRPKFREDWIADQILAFAERGTPLPDGREDEG